MPTGHRVDTAVLQVAGKHRAPAVEICLARCQAHAVVAISADRQVHVGSALVFVQHEHILVSLEQFARRLASGFAHGRGGRAGRHRENNVESLAPRTVVVDVRTGDPPLVGQLDQAFSALYLLAALVLDLQRLAPAPGFFLALATDVPEVGRDGLHATPTPGDLDHHLRRARRHSAANAAAHIVG